MTVPLSYKTVSEGQEPLGLSAVSVATLVPSAVLPIDLYLKPAVGERPVLYRERDFPITADDIERLLRSGIRCLYIAKASHDGYQQYLRENLDTFVADERLPPERRLQFLVETARDVLLEAFTKGDTDCKVYESTRFASTIVRLLAKRNLLFADVFGMLYHDYRTFTHTTNVAIYSVMLAEKLGIDDEGVLEEIATGGLLHDIGKRVVPASVVSKNGPLTGQERRLVGLHPQAGFEELCHRDDVTWGQLMMVYQHHERLDGKGYPVGLRGDKIHEWARLCAVTDIFDAVSSERPYRRAMPVTEVLALLKRQAGRALDKEMVRCWVGMMTGSC